MQKPFLRTHSKFLYMFVLLIATLTIRSMAPAWAVQGLIFSGGFETLVANKAPTAEAGTDQRVYGGGSFPALLKGERSEDVDSAVLTARWQQLSGPPVAFGEARGLNQEYFPPPVETETLLEFRLTVTDSNGAADSDVVSVVLIPGKITASISLQRVIPKGFLAELFLFAADGTLLASGSGNNISIDYDVGAGVIYAVATAASQADMNLTVGFPDGLEVISEVTASKLSSISQAFVLTSDLVSNLENLLVLGISPLTGGVQPLRSYEHPQIIEIALPHPDPGLRDPNRFLSFLNQTSIRYQEDSASTEAYYRAIDPDNTRTTLDDWLQVTGFKDDGDDASATYQNDADLGFGREMHMRQNVDGTVAGYVRNFPSLDHTLANEKLIATVTMEFGPAAGHVASYTKFFAYGPDGQRLLAADLDGRGAKAIPGACNVCHGGSPKPTFRDNSGIVTYPDQGDTNAQFLPWDLDTFVFSGQPGLSRTEQEQAFFDLNQLAKATYPSIPDNVNGVNWTGAATTELINGWYAGGQVFNGKFVPPGWDEQPEHAALYREVVGPNCRACHVTRGTAKQHTIDLSTYAKFIAYAPLIKELVYQQGVMPLASRTFGHFWRGAENSPATKLATVLAELSPGQYPLLQANGDALKPGRPESRTGMLLDGPPFLTAIQNNPLGILLDGTNSLFAPEQDRRVITLSRIGENTTEFGRQAITNPGQGDDGNIIRLARQIVAPAAVRRTIFGRAELNQPSFFWDIRPLLNEQCVSCHSAGGPFPNIPVRFDHEDILVTFREVLDRINFEQPPQSLFLTKPGGLRHGFNADPSVLFASPRSGWEYFTGVDGGIRPMSSMGSAALKVTQWIQSGVPFWDDSSSLISHSCQNVGQAIPDNDNNGLRDRLYIGPAQISKSFEIQLKLDHTFLNDLEVTLTNLDTGLTSILVNRPLGADNISCDRQDINAFFTSAYGTNANLCQAGTALLTVQPDSPLSVFDETPLAGNWQLTVKDLAAGETGTLNEWCIRNQK